MPDPRNLFTGQQPEFRQFFEAVPVPTLVLDPRLRIVAVNDAYLQATKVLRADILGRPLFEVFPDNPGDAEASGVRNLSASLQWVLDNNAPHAMAIQKYDIPLHGEHEGEFEVRYWRPLNTPVFNAAGELTHVLHQVEDVTATSLKQQATEESEARFRQIANAIPQIVWSARPDGYHDYFNQQWYDYTGVPQGSTDGEEWSKLFHSEDRPRIWQLWGHSLATGEPYEIEYRVRHHSGEYRWVLGRALPIRNEAGAIERWMGTCTDIHAQKLAERLRQQSEIRFRTLAENIPQLAWMANSDGNIFWYNNRWFEYTGTTLEEMKGWGWTRVHHPDCVEQVKAKYRREIVERQVTWEDTFPLRSANGEYRWFLSRAVPIRDADGVIVRWLGTNTDITDQRHAREALQQENQSKDDFLAMLAHELRNPLAPISTAAELLKLASQDEKVRRTSEIIARQVWHLTELVDDLLDVSRVTRGLVQMDMKEIGFQSVVQGAIEQAMPLIEKRGHKLFSQLPAEPLRVQGDYTRLVQVVANLLNNSAKYTPHGGEIRLHASVRDGRLHFSVSDNGQGIEAALLPHVFDLFTQAKRTPDRAQGGLGLGLALVKSIMALHGGSVTAASDGRGKGSSFTLVLPVSISDHAPAGLAHGANGAAHFAQPLRIQIVDDNRDAAESLAALLRAQGHMVSVRENAQSALDEARASQPQVFILDIGLPDFDGYELSRRLHAHPENERALFIALTGYGRAQDKQQAKAAGFDHYFVKPMDMGALQQVLAAQ